MTGIKRHKIFLTLSSENRNTLYCTKGRVYFFFVYFVLYIYCSVSHFMSTNIESFQISLKVLRREHFQINGSNLFCFLLNDWISSPLSVLLTAPKTISFFFRSIFSVFHTQTNIIERNVCVTKIKQ